MTVFLSASVHNSHSIKYISLEVILKENLWSSYSSGPIEYPCCFYNDDDDDNNDNNSNNDDDDN